MVLSCYSQAPSLLEATLKSNWESDKPWFRNESGILISPSSISFWSHEKFGVWSQLDEKDVADDDDDDDGDDDDDDDAEDGYNSYGDGAT